MARKYRDDNTVHEIMTVLLTTQRKPRALAEMNLTYGFDKGGNTMDCDEVYPNIFISDAASAKDKAYLKRLGITHVVNAAEGKLFGMVDTNENYYRETNIKYLGVPLMDLPCSNISQYFEEVSAFMSSALTSGGRVLVHCLVGMSRSSSCVIAHLMIKEHLPAVVAVRLVAMARDIRPNDGFIRQLAQLDNKLQFERTEIADLWPN